MSTPMATAAENPATEATSAAANAQNNGQNEATETPQQPVRVCGCHSSLEGHLNHIRTFEEGMNAKLRKMPPVDKQYDSVRVLMVYWQGSDVDHLSKNAVKLKTCFADGYGYSVDEHVLQNLDDKKDNVTIWQDFNNELAATIQKISDMNKDNLLILYYAGHGAEVKDKSGRVITHVWQPTGENPNRTLEWKDFQFALKRVHCDILFLFDCCYALAMIDDDQQWTRRAEIFCASSALERASALKSSSFTRAIRKELWNRREKRGNAVGWYYTLLTGTKETMQYKLLQAPHHRKFSGPAFRTGIFLESKKFVPQDPPAIPVVQAADSASDSGVSMASSAVVQRFRDLSNLTNARVLIKIRLRDPAQTLLEDDWLKMFEHRPANADLIQLAVIDNVHLEGFFEAESSLLLVTMPIALWHDMEHNPAYENLGLVRSENLLSTSAAVKMRENVDAAAKLKQKEQELDDRVAKFDLQTKSWNEELRIRAQAHERVVKLREEREATLSRREQAALAKEQQMVKDLEERERRESERERRLAEKEQNVTRTLDERAAIVVKGEEQLARKKEHLSEKEDNLSKKEANLSQKESSLSEKEEASAVENERLAKESDRLDREKENLEKRERQVVTEERAVRRREVTVFEDEESLKRQTKELRIRELVVARREGELQKRESAAKVINGLPPSWFDRGSTTKNLTDRRTSHLIADTRRMPPDGRLSKVLVR